MRIELEEGWNVMETGITKLKAFLEGQSETGSKLCNAEEYMQMYTTAYNMCTQKPPYDYSGVLYERYEKSINDYIDQMVLPSLREKHAVFFLRELDRRWSNHKLMVRWLSRFFHYLDRYFIARRSLPTLTELGKNCFYNLVYTELKYKAIEAIIVLIDQERLGEMIDQALVKNVLSTFMEFDFYRMELYKNDFEASMLESTSAYYARKASNHILVDSFSDYMIMVEQCLQSEKDRVSHYLHKRSEPKLLERTLHELLFVHAKQVLENENSGLHTLLRDGQVMDLSRMYRLFSRKTEELHPVSMIFKEHITWNGTALVKEAEDVASQIKKENRDRVSFQAQVFVRKALELHEKYMSYVNDCFSGHIIFHKALIEGFECFCNKEISGISSAEIFATFCDNILKRGSGREKPIDEAIGETLEKVVGLLSYLDEKDLFAELCRKKLARRLLCDGSANYEHERSLLSKLKQQFGGQFTSKMEGMVRDLILARDAQAEFENYLTDHPNEDRGTDMAVTIITTGYWPTYKSFDLNVPSELSSCIEVFSKSYKSNTRHRKLTWIFSLGNCNVIGRFEPKLIELQLSTHQAATLLLFNTSPRLSFSNIMSQLNLPSEEVIKLLHSLSCSKYKILSKEPNTKNIFSTDIFEFNSTFTDKMRRIKVPLPRVEEEKKVIEDVGKDRIYAIDAAVVRIMKSRIVLGHQQLLMECLQQLNRLFQPDVKMIKKQIENLIHREFLMRDPDDSTKYIYLA